MKDLITKRKTLFIDIDGTLFKHYGSLQAIFQNEPELLPGVMDKIEEWKFHEHFICITTARPESMRKLTEEQLQKVGLFYDLLIMGLPHGERIVINDSKPNIKDTAIGISIPRNEGLQKVNI